MNPFTTASRMIIRSMLSSSRPRWLARPSMIQVGVLARKARDSDSWNRMLNSKTCVSSWPMSEYSLSGGSSIGMTMRFSIGSAKAPTNSGMNPRSMFVCSNSTCVL